jgi:hypothetical protein
MAKRSVLSKSRRQQLSHEELTYIVQCGTSDCPCKVRSPNRCERGFFSLFMQALNGIDFARRNNCNCRVDYGNVIYPYTQNEKRPENFWNNYFQPANNSIVREKIEMVEVLNEFNEVYPLRIWNRDYVKHMNEVFASNIQFLPWVQQKLEQLNEMFRNKRFLGIQYRGLDHYEEIPPIPMDKVLRRIGRHLYKYDQLFLATDDQDVLEKFKAHFGERLVFHEHLRMTGNKGIHESKLETKTTDLGMEALVDCYSLALCNKTYLMHSNLGFASLIFNPDLDYELLETSYTKYRRYLTLFLYFLDKWGIRKW